MNRVASRHNSVGFPDPSRPLSIIVSCPCLLLGTLVVVNDDVRSDAPGLFVLLDLSSLVSKARIQLVLGLN